MRWIIDTVLIENKRVGQSADFQQPVPVRGVPRQPGNFQPEHDAGLAQAYLRNELLKALSIDSRCAGLSEIAVDDDNALHGPAQGNGMLAQSVLPLGAFGILEHLAKGRLADIKIGVPPQVPGVHFGVPRLSWGCLLL